MLEKFNRRQGEVVAREAFKVVQANQTLKGLLAQFPALRFGDLNDGARDFAKKLDPNNVVFPKTGKQVKILRMLGKGGMGGAVFLGEDQTGHKYAVKHFVRANHTVPGYAKDTARGKLDKTSHYLMKYFEAALTTTRVRRPHDRARRVCAPRVRRGQRELQDAEHLGHSERLRGHAKAIRVQPPLHDRGHHAGCQRSPPRHPWREPDAVRGKLRLIDFGQALIFSPGQEEDVRTAKAVKYDRNNSDLYFQNDSFLEGKQDSTTQTKAAGSATFEDWQKAYREAPVVKLSRGLQPPIPAQPRHHRVLPLRVEEDRKVEAAQGGH